MENNEDFEWIKLENKVRVLIKDILQPFLNQFQTTETNQEKNQVWNSQQEKKIRELQKQIDELENKVPSSKSINNMFIDSSVKINSAEIEGKKNKDVLLCEISAVTVKLQTLNTEVQSLMNQITLVQQETKQANSNTYAIKSNLDRDMKEVKQYAKRKVNESIKNITDLAQKHLKLEKKFGFVEKSLCEEEFAAKNNEKKIAEIKFFLEKEIQSLRDEEAKFQIYLKNINREMANAGKLLREEADLMREGITEKVGSEMVLFEDKQNDVVYEWLSYSIVDKKSKERMMRFKEKYEKKKKKKLEIVLEAIPSSASLIERKRYMSLSYEKNGLKLSSSLVFSRKKSLDYLRNSSNFSDGFKNALSKPLMKPVATSMPVFKNSEILETFKEVTVFDAHDAVSQSHQIFKAIPEEVYHKNSIKIIPKSLSESSLTNYEHSEISFPSSPKAKHDLSNSNIISQSLNKEYLEKIEKLQEKIEIIEKEIREIKTESGINSDFSNTLSNALKDLKDQQTQSLGKIDTYIEKNLKSWVINSISSTYEDTIKNLIASTENLQKNIDNLSKSHQFLSEDLILAQTDFSSYISSKKREIVDFSLKLKRNEKILNSFSEQICEIRNEVDKANRNKDAFIEFLNINYCLLKQDEIDKKNLGLIGSRTGKDLKKKKSGKNVIALDKSCISCASNMPQVLPAFKMACLAYNSSPVSIGNKLISRSEALDIQSKILQEVKSELVNIEIPETRYRSLTPDLPKIHIKMR